MTHFGIVSAIAYTWEALGLVWLGGLAFTKRAVRRQPTGARLFTLATALTGFVLLGSSWFTHSWLATRFLPEAEQLELAGLILTVVGCMFAIWARITLGGNWSAQATVKAGHQLITGGPYAVTRHPIYTGLVTAAIGTAIAVGELRCILGMMLIVLAFTIKMSQEEKLMMLTFPEAYPRYRERVKALIPGVL
jgi:protein-S-isoprenylcysteine O-methyltransferase Ste14